ncbi:hypothetical protein LguiA_002063 [Lonicera macranthoides]
MEETTNNIAEEYARLVLKDEGEDTLEISNPLREENQNDLRWFLVAKSKFALHIGQNSMRNRPERDDARDSRFHWTKLRFSSFLLSFGLQLEKIQPDKITHLTVNLPTTTPMPINPVLHRIINVEGNYSRVTYYFPLWFQRWWECCGRGTILATKYGVYFVLALELKRERNAAIMLARRSCLVGSAPGSMYFTSRDVDLI